MKSQYYLLPILVLTWNSQALQYSTANDIWSKSEICCQKNCFKQIEEIVDKVLSSRTATSTGCPSPWIHIGRSCIFTDKSLSLSWQKARTFCSELNQEADLVTYKDANEFADLLRHLRAINSENTPVNFWIGGSDLDKEDEWIFVNGNPMPMGSPFWGSVPAYLPEPQKTGERCAFFYFPDRYYVHNVNCNAGSHKIAPFCQFDPFSKRGSV